VTVGNVAKLAGCLFADPLLVVIREHEQMKLRRVQAIVDARPVDEKIRHAIPGFDMIRFVIHVETQRRVAIRDADL
jgi:hypothetical protein